MTSTNQTTYVHFQTFQTDQTTRFLEFQNKQFQEFMTLYPSTKTDIEICGSEQTEKSKKKELKAPKKQKAPKKPKGARNAYTFFSQKANKSMKEENPEAKFGELSKLISGLWKEMVDESKQPFIKLAEQDKIRANKEKEEWDEKVASMSE
jgi:hypothetical protein